MSGGLGFGCMRLPLLDKGSLVSFDYDMLNSMVDTFLDSGYNYFDTAYTYHAYRSEEAVRQALVRRHPRNRFRLATKLPMRDIQSPGDVTRVFDEQLKKCGVDFFDNYLLHNIGTTVYRKAVEWDCFGFCARKKEEGRIKRFGISFHDKPELLDEILLAYPELDFVQLQINYADWDNPGVEARRCYETAVKHNKPIIVMEPCKGGNLAKLPEKAERLMREYAPNATIPSWAIRFAAGLEGVVTVLSGMSDLHQLTDNIACLSAFKSLDDEQTDILKQVVRIINESTAIPCTACRYCENGCPESIPISDYFALYNGARSAVTDNVTSLSTYYLNFASDHGRARDCSGCGQCEKACPQHIGIIELLKEVSNQFDV